MRKIQNENILYLDYETTILDYVCDLFEYVTFFSPFTLLSCVYNIYELLFSMRSFNLMR